MGITMKIQQETTENLQTPGYWSGHYWIKSEARWKLRKELNTMLNSMKINIEHSQLMGHSESYLRRQVQSTKYLLKKWLERCVSSTLESCITKTKK